MPKGTRELRRYGAYLLIGLLACGPSFGLAQEMKQRGKDKPVNVNAKALTVEQKVLHLLDRASFGPRPGEVERVLKMGWQKYLDAQLNPERLDDQALEQKLKNIESQRLSNSELAQTYYPPQQVLAATLKARGLDIADMKGGQANADQMTPDKANEQAKDGNARRREARRVLAEAGYKPGQQLIAETQAAKIQRAVYSERQLQEVMTDFWFNHFNVYMQKGADRVLTTAYERDTIRPRVFGKFEDLLKATAESPAMLWYLDNWQSASPNMKMPAFNNRNELRQMRSDGDLTKIDRQRLKQMREVMTQRNAQNQQNPQVKPQPKRMPRGINENYAREIMELHTLGVDGGYTQKDVQEVARCFTGWTLRTPRAGAEFFFSKFMHDDGEKTVLGKKIPAGGGVQDGYAVIHILATQPSTAKFISTKLARKFVADNPPPALVNKMAQTFQKTEGDIREVLKTMFSAPGFWSPEVYRTKIKTPFEMTVSAVRALGAETNGNPQFHRWLAQMGEGLFLMQPPTGYPDTSEQWVNTGALLERMNFALALSANRIVGTRVDLSKLAPSAPLNSQAQLVDYYAKVLLRGEVSAQTRATIDKSLSETQVAMNNRSAAAEPATDAAKIVGLLLGSPEFQRQ
ncbi:MAG: DUF1800 domain-containing protein [Acidobacteria bacterium]|nr:DUF1800 domain-containing protein [Acidobacteriota bacterium]